jgi:hypothetical protein
MNAVTPQQIQNQAQRMPAASQATNIEQARAIAEVHAMFMVAKQNPRDEAQAMSRALHACAEWSVASRAFFSFPRGTENVTGESIVLATELARCWGNIDYGIMELARDDVAGNTEMLAFARDLETNTQSRQTFIVPHSRDTRHGRKPLSEMRDIYENNANNGARRLRECIFRVLPAYVKNAAADKCRDVLENGPGDRPLPLRIADAIDAFSKIGVNVARITAKHGATDKWTGVEIANLEIAYRSIKRGETTIDEAFPQVVENLTDEVRKAVADQTKAKAKAGGRTKSEQAEIPEWIAHETRISDLLFLAQDRVQLEATEKEFLSVSATFPDAERTKMQGRIDEAFAALVQKDD